MVAQHLSLQSGYVYDGLLEYEEATLALDNLPTPKTRLMMNIGGLEFEPNEENPMLGFRGASRYYSPRYREGFALECKAIKRVREEIGLSNVVIMIPFCRTLDEADQVIEVLEENGLK